MSGVGDAIKGIAGSMSAEDWLKTLNTLGSLANRARKAFEEHRKAAEAVGVPRDMIEAATARLIKNYDDPLAGQPGVPEPAPAPVPVPVPTPEPTPVPPPVTDPGPQPHPPVEPVPTPVPVPEPEPVEPPIVAKPEYGTLIDGPVPESASDARLFPFKPGDQVWSLRGDSKHGNRWYVIESDDQPRGKSDKVFTIG